MQHRYSGSINPKKITEARESRGYNMTETATLIGVSRQAMHRYEQGLSNPSEKVLLTISDKLGFPLPYFYNDVELKVAIGTTFFRSMKTSDIKIRSMVDVRCNWMGLIYFYLSHYLNLPAIRLPKMDLLLRREILSEEEIEECALALRKHWGLGMLPIDNLVNCAEDNGIVVFGTDINNKKVDACHKMIAERPIVFISSDKESSCRNRFSLAHELGHMLLHSHITIEDLNDKEVLKRIEREANRFASAFLMPREAIVNDVCASNLNFLLMLKRKWKVSVAALTYRCNELGVFDEDQILSIRKQMSYKRWNAFEPFDDVIAVEQPRLLKTALKILFENNLVTKQEFLNAFDLPIDVVAQMCNVGKDFFSDNNRVTGISIVK